jgi:hypothetical protein
MSGVSGVSNLHLRYIASTKRPILVGPWTSEMGFEALYWLPYLQYLRHTYKLSKDRLIAVSRGGAGIWYDAGTAVELYDYVPPSDLRISALKGQKEQSSIKQLGLTTWEGKLLDLLAERLGLRRYHVLHPSLMYQTLDSYWGNQTMGFAQAMNQLRFAPISTPPVPVGLSLPEQFIAVRWYQRPTWPLREDLLDWTHAMTREIAKTMPVVVLRSSAYLDDHVDFPAPDGPNITVIQAEPWRDNLAVQSAILKKASAFVGTWGGMAQLAVRLGVATAGFYDKWHSCSYAHKHLTDWLGLQMGIPVFVGRPHDLEFGRTILPAQIPLPELPRGSSS